MLTRRRFGRRVAAGTAAAWALRAAPPGPRPNVLLITADDMDYESLGVTGSSTPDVTPNLDALAAQGLRFAHAHVTISVCQPCRSVLMTGRYPHRNGARGFEPISRDVPTLGERLRAGGYVNGIMAKVPHLTPQEKFCWDGVVGAGELGTGRDPAAYGRRAKEFFLRAKAAGAPFFLMANSQDPHRPFAGSAQEKHAEARGRRFPGVRRTYRPEEVSVPGFLPDIPAVRREVAQYYTSVHRCDETVGELLKALRDAGAEERTLVVFLSDNGMAFPFAKTNCWRASTRTPLIVRWPGTVSPGRVDAEHLVSAIDFMPTVLEAAGCPAVPGVDGRSFLSLLSGGRQEGRDTVYTVFHETSARKAYPMRAVQTARYGYIFNAWSDGTTVFRNESQSGITFGAMQEAAKTDPGIEARVRFFLYRVPEELYDYEKDPYARTNLIDEPQHRAVLGRLRARMEEVMRAADDPLLPAFRARVRR